MAITHTKVSAVPDGADATLVRPSDWNASHTIDSGTIAHADLGSVTANQHHSEDHVLADGTSLGTHHTVSGLTAGWVLRAFSATTAKFMQLVHGDLGSVGADDHHAKSHGHTGADGSGTVAHSATTGITATDHHVAPAAGPDADVTVDAAGAAGTAATFARSAHGHKLATSAATPTATDATAGSAGTSGHAPSRDDHRHLGHAQSHDHSAAGDGTSLSPATLILPGATAPAQTAEGSVVWDTDDDRLTIGTGAARKLFLPTGDENLSGTLAGRPTAAYAGRTYFATDVLGGAMFYDTGSAWSLIGPSVAATIGSVTTFNGTSQAAGTDVSLWAPWTIPASFLAVGTTFKVDFGLDVDIVNSATARNLVFKLKLGSTVILTFTIAVLVSTLNTNKGTIGYLEFACHTTGASGVIRAQGAMVEPWGSAAVDKSVQATSAVAGVTVDTTASQAITLTVNESVNSVADLVRSETGSLTLTKL